MSRVAEPIAWPLTKPATTTGKRASDLHADWVKAFDQVEKIEGERAKTRADLREAEAVMRSATAPKARAEAEAAHAAAREALNGPWDARLDAPRRASEDAHGALRAYVDANFEELCSEPELGEAADLTRDGILNAAESVIAGVERWGECRRAFEPLVRFAEQLDVRALPDLPPQVRDLVRACEVVLEKQATAPTAGRVQAPRPSQRHLDQRTIDRGEAEVEHNA
ncbi:MAG TPA: hypothetical protein VG816_13750 [Solirubrobacterales bacterium]|nr:hypothetical protein [Solirubrobacterales bacterium]